MISKQGIVQAECIDFVVERFNPGTLITKAKSYERLKPSQDKRLGAADSPV